MSASPLARQLDSAFEAELGKLRAIWWEDSPALRQELMKRAERVRARLPTHEPSTTRRAALALRLAELMGEELPEELDAVLACGLEHLSTDHLRAFGDLALRALDGLSEARRAPLRALLARRAFTSVTHRGVLHVELLVAELGAEGAAWLYEQAAAPPLWTDLPPALLPPQVLTTICRYGGYPTIPEALWPWLAHTLSGHCTGAGRGGESSHHLAWMEALRLMPPAALEELLLTLTPTPWEFYVLCPTERVLAHVAAKLRAGVDSSGMNAAQLGLRALGRPIVPVVLELVQGGGGRWWFPTLVALAGEAELDAVVPLLDAGLASWDMEQLRRLLCRVELGALSGAVARQAPRLSEEACLLLLEVAACRACNEDAAALLDALEARLDPSPDGEVARRLAFAREHLGRRAEDCLPDALVLFHDPKVEVNALSSASQRLLVAQQRELAQGASPASYRYDYVLERLESAAAPIHAWAWVCGLSSYPARVVLEHVVTCFPATVLRRVGLALLRAAPPHASMKAIYAWLLEGVDRDDEALHLYVLEQGGAALQDLAIGALAQRADPPVEPVLTLLTSARSGVRIGAARALERLGSARAGEVSEALRTALRKERTKTVRAAIESALVVLDPRAQASGGAGEGAGPRIAAQGFPLEQGTWQTLEGQTARDLMTELREVLYLSPSPVVWARTCDLLARLELLGALEPGVEYVQAHATDERWPIAGRSAPWGWREHPLLRPLVIGPQASAPESQTLPLAALQSAGRGPFFEALLPRLEAKRRQRTFRMHLVDVFLAAVHSAWDFCEEHRVELSRLEVAVDGGSVRRGHAGRAPTTTRLELHQGFCARLLVATARHEVVARLPGLRYATLTMPTRHPLREVVGMKPNQRTLDLIPLLGLAEGVGEQEG